MWKIIALAGLMLIGFGLAAAQQNVYDGDIGRPISFIPEGQKNVKCLENNLKKHTKNYCTLSVENFCGSIVPPEQMIPEIACGKRNENGVNSMDDRTASDRDNQARFGEFPWVVAILPRNWARPTVSSVPCGGSLIHPKAVLTTAFCVIHNHQDNLVIRAGEWDIRSTSEGLPYQDRFVEKIIFNEAIDAGLYSRDYAILILKNPFDISPHINVVCLPRRNEVFSGSRCFAAGWGNNVFGRRETVLKKTVSTIVPNDECQRLLQTATDNGNLVLDRSHLCAADSVNVGMCQGDIGFPLVCPRRFGGDIRYLQTGIVAWGIACARPDKPVVYANVAFARPWINKVMKQNNLQASWYTY